MRFDISNRRNHRFVKRPLLSFSSFVLAVIVGLISSFTFSTIYDMVRASLSDEPQTIYGVWQGSWQGVPAVTIVLKEDGGMLSGTAQFSTIVKSIDGPTVIGQTSELSLVKPKFDGNRLSFEVRNSSDSYPVSLAEMEMSFLSDSEAELRCRGGQPEGAPEDREIVIRMKRERSF